MNISGGSSPFRNFSPIKISDEITKERFFNNLNGSQKEALKILSDPEVWKVVYRDRLEQVKLIC